MGTFSGASEHRIIIRSFDKADWPNNPTPDEKREIIEIGAYEPNDPFPVDKEDRNRNRSFDERFDIKKNASISPAFRRHWLSYSPKLNVVYCLPCWLLLYTLRNNQCLVKDIADLAHLSRNIDRHENSQQRATSCEIYDRWKAEKTIDSLQTQQLEDISRYWRLVLRRIFDVTLNLARNDLPFPAHRIEDNPVISEGNFLEFINLLSHYDPFLEELLKRRKGTVNYLSPQIQNEVLETLANKMNPQIRQEIEDAAFVSIITDSTQDLSKIDQLSIAFRYVSLKKDEIGNLAGIEIIDFLLALPKLKVRRRQYWKILYFVIQNSADLSKLRGQGYDGAANMCGDSGLQARINEKNPYARYIHCCAHNLNLVISDAVRAIPELRNFFDNLEQLRVFFSVITR